MNVSIAEVPHVEIEKVTLANRNGTWSEERPKPSGRLGINFTDSDTSGQAVTLNRIWLDSYGIHAPYFQHADGTSISNSGDEYRYHIYPSHFSILYAFSSGEGFFLEGLQTYSDVHWDSTNRNIYVVSDRRDPVGTNERLRSVAPVTYDQTTSFSLRATWKTSQQGNWQVAAPIFFMGASNSRLDMANSAFVYYYSRDSNLGYSPDYYLRYYDSTGTLRVNSVVRLTANAQYEFLISFNAYTRVMSLAIFNSLGNSVLSTTYTLGTGQSFSMGKIGAAAWGLSSSLEPTIIAKTDNIYFDASMARNGNFETDSNSDGIPDNWEPWIWSDACTGCISRSSSFTKYGTWSVRILDSDSTKDYGLQSVRMTASPANTYVGSTWVYVSSGLNAMCLEFWNAYSGGSRLAVACKNTVTTAQWEYLDVALIAPTGTVAIDLLVYSSGTNVGTGYFDGAELRLRRAFWSVTHHDGEHATWQQAADFAADLGVSYIRTDFVWSAFEPNSAQLDPNVLSTWHDNVNVLKTRGVFPIVILKGGYPSWAACSWTLWLSQGACPQAYYDQFGGFCQAIAQAFGSDIYYYQILNEWNHAGIIDMPGSDISLIKSCYQGLLNGYGVAAAAHKSVFKTILNVWFDDPDPVLDDIWLRLRLSSEAGPGIDIAAVDHYPGTWSGPTYTWADCVEWSPLDYLSQTIRDFNKEGAIMETGFSSYVWPFHTEYDQDWWVGCAMPSIKAKVNSQNTNYPLNPIILANFYDLVDSNTGGICLPLPQECHFGLLYDSLAQKFAYATFRGQIPNFN